MVNRILSALGVVIVRKDTLNQLIGNRAIECPNQALLPELAQALDKLLDAENQHFRELLRHQISTKWGIIDAAERHQPKRPTLTCPLCGFQGQHGSFPLLMTNCIFEGGELHRHQCPECDLIFGDKKMFALSEAELATEYEWHYKAFFEADATPHEVRAFHALSPRKDGLYLNWGAGAWSNSIEVLRREGWNVHGYEPHASATNENPYVISSKARLLQMRFDGIFSNNVLEHLRYPARELSSMGALLKPGARMSHATPCFEYMYEYTRFHLFFFPGRSRAVLVKNANLRIEDYIAEGEFMNLVLSKD